MENAALLLELDSLPENLLNDIFGAKCKRLMEDMDLLVVRAEKYELQGIEGRKPESKEDETKEDRPDNNGDDRSESASRKKRQGTDFQGKDLISLMQANFLQDFVLFTEAFLDTFMRQKRKRKSLSTLQADPSVARCSEALIGISLSCHPTYRHSARLSVCLSFFPFFFGRKCIL